MCLGAGARAANEAARRNYEYKLEKREREWMNTLSMTKVEHIQYEQGVDASNLGLANTYSDIAEKKHGLIDKFVTASQEDWKEYLSENTGDKLKASGRLGRSSDRISAIDLGQYLKKGSDKAYALTKAGRELDRVGMKAAGQARSQQMQMFTNVAFVKNPDMVPPKPVYQNVMQAAFMDALSIAGSVASIYAASSKKLKDNIVKIGESISGYNVYKFNYKGDSKKYIGVIAEEIQQLKPEAVRMLPNGYLGVNYNLLDVEFKEA